jgi:hypothetical protein
MPIPMPLRVARVLAKKNENKKTTDEAPVQDTATQVEKMAIDASNEALQNTPEMIAAKQAQELLAPGLNKEFDKVTNVGTYVTALPGLSSATDVNEISDAQIEEDLGWINYYRNKFDNAMNPKNEEGEEEYSYFSFERYKQQVTNYVANNALIKTTKNLIEHKILALTQSLAEMMNLVRPGENVMDLDSKELDERVDKLNALLQDPKMQEKIAETAQHVAEASKEPLKEMTAELTKLTSDFAKEAAEQSAQIAVSAVGAIPGPGNVISILNAAQKTTDLITDVAGKTNDAVELASKAGEQIGDNLKEMEKEVEKVEAPTTEASTMQMPGATAGGAKMIKSQMNSSKQILKRVNKSLKEHFNQFKKNVTKHSTRKLNNKSKKRGLYNRIGKTRKK